MVIFILNRPFVGKVNFFKNLIYFLCFISVKYLMFQSMSDKMFSKPWNSENSEIKITDEAEDNGNKSDFQDRFEVKLFS